MTGEKMNDRSADKAEDRYRLLVENINDVSFSLDTKGRFIYISPVVERKTGYSPREIIGQSFGRFVHPDDLYRAWSPR